MPKNKPQKLAPQPLICSVHCSDSTFAIKCYMKDSTLEQAKDKIKSLVTIATNPKFAYIYDGNGVVLYEHLKRN